MRFIHEEASKAPVLEILMALGNTMFIALPIAEALYGEYAVFILSVSCIPFNVLLYSYGVWRLKGGGGRQSVRIRDIFSVPLITTLFGIILLIFDVHVKGPIKELLASLGNVTMPLSMIVIGASLGSVSLLDAFRNTHLAVLSAVKLILIPCLAWPLCRILTHDTVLVMTCMIIAASPSAVVGSVLAIQYGQDAVFSSEAVQHSTLCSIVQDKNLKFTEYSPIPDSL